VQSCVAVCVGDAAAPRELKSVVGLGSILSMVVSAHAKQEPVRE
jgi:hypothetical protein